MTATMTQSAATRSAPNAVAIQSVVLSAVTTPWSIAYLTREGNAIAAAESRARHTTTASRTQRTGLKICRSENCGFDSRRLSGAIPESSRAGGRASTAARRDGVTALPLSAPAIGPPAPCVVGSEERSVGEEGDSTCSYRRAPYY